ncbi:uncharacterized protein LOC125238683 [Leguminivora glycinivorella]|uniref:uncharacterized protein LOC125238683 n=1 Tax=Leguminivora glycinivorella TaxID=1035111 RepID=UPI00200BC01C|nr:uncharacterized protein LOC125238683 [Leguminivora glycinivorella]
MKCYLIVFLISFIYFSVSVDKQSFTYDLRRAEEFFEEFQKYYKKNYTPEEKKLRYKIFKANLKRVNAINQNVILKWIAVIGPYNDLTYAEFVKKYDLPEFGEEKQVRNLVTCTDQKMYLFKRFSEYTKGLYDKWGSWRPPAEYETEELTDYDEYAIGHY